MSTHHAIKGGFEDDFDGGRIRVARQLSVRNAVDSGIKLCSDNCRYRTHRGLDSAREGGTL
jgi:hypothetical protein